MQIIIRNSETNFIASLHELHAQCQSQLQKKFQSESSEEQDSETTHFARGSHAPMRATLSLSRAHQAVRSVAQLLQWKPKPPEKVDHVVVNGFVRSVRSMKAHRFVSLGDGSSLAPLQAVVQADHAEGCAPKSSPRLGCPSR